MTRHRPASSGRCRWWRRPGTACSTMPRVSTSPESTSSRRSTAPPSGPVRRGQRRRRNRDELPWLQGRHRHRVARDPGPSEGRLHRRCAGPVQLRPAAAAHDRGRSGRDRRSPIWSSATRGASLRPAPWLRALPPCAAVRRRTGSAPTRLPGPRAWGPSSSWSPPTRRCSPTSSSGWPSVPRSASDAWAGWGRTARATSFIAFSTANPRAAADTGLATRHRAAQRPDQSPSSRPPCRPRKRRSSTPCSAAETMTGADSVRSYALPHERLRAVMRKYNRVAGPQPR